MEPVVVSQDIQVANLRGAGYSLSDNTIQLLVRIATGDVVREILGQPPWLPSIEQDVVRLATETLDAGILSENLLGVKRDIRSRTILIPIPDVDSAAWEAVSPVVYEVAAEFLAANKSLDDVAMAKSRDEAAEQVEAEQIEYPAGTIIVEQGEEITEQIERALEAGATARFQDSPPCGPRSRCAVHSRPDHAVRLPLPGIGVVLDAPDRPAWAPDHPLGPRRPGSGGLRGHQPGDRIPGSGRGVRPDDSDTVRRPHCGADGRGGRFDDSSRHDRSRLHPLRGPVHPGPGAVRVIPSRRVATYAVRPSTSSSSRLLWLR